MHDLTSELFRELREEQDTVQAFDEAAAQLLAVNLTDLRCLGLLERKGPMAASELAQESGLTTGSVTALIDRLERAEYVRRVRDDRDRRRVFVELTERAVEAFGAIWGPLGRDGSELVSRYSAEELQVVIGYLRASRELLQTHLERVRKMQAGR